ncbi:hypothetical protein FD754_003190, partial [Muntiacus muntjak]
PDYVKDHLPQVAQHTAYIGEKCPALEKTGDLRYLWRPASNRSLPAKYKPEYAGEIGWGIPEYDFINKTRLQTGFHIKKKPLSDSSLVSIILNISLCWTSSTNLETGPRDSKPTVRIVPVIQAIQGGKKKKKHKMCKD